jgi:hypothetical protein
MDKNNLINEEVNRIKLLFKYDSQQTLSENLENISEQGALGGILRGDAALARTTARELEAGISGLKGGVTRMDGVLLRDAEDIVKAVKAGKLAPAELGKVNAALLKNTTNPAVKKAVIQDVVGSGTFAAKYGTKTEAEAIAALEAKGWSKADAKAAVSEYKTSGKSFKGGKPTTPKNTPPKKAPVKRKPKPIPNKATRWESFKSRIKGLARNRVVQLLVGAGGLYLLYKWLTSEGATPFPTCLTTNMSTEDLQKMHDEGVDDIFIATTGNSTIDANGGGRFSDKKDFTTANGKYKGTWEEEEGVGIVITINGKTFTMACGEQKQEDDDDNNGGGGGGTSKYHTCSDNFPIAKFCKNDTIRKVQGCLGIQADGAFGPKTGEALKGKGLSGDEITQETVDKVCGGSTTSTTTIYNAERTTADSQEL